MGMDCAELHWGIALCKRGGVRVSFAVYILDVQKKRKKRRSLFWSMTAGSAAFALQRLEEI